MKFSRIFLIVVFSQVIKFFDEQIRSVVFDLYELNF